MAKKKRKVMRRIRKQSSPLASTIAARYMNKLTRFLALEKETAHEGDGPLLFSLPVAELYVLCGSVLGQDETRGQSRDHRRP